MIGKVYLVGAGPGDPGLVTVKALNLLARADVVIYDQLASPELLKKARPDAEILYVGKKAGAHTLPQGGINLSMRPFLIVSKLSAGTRCRAVSRSAKLGSSLSMDCAVGPSPKPVEP